ncbi:DUF3037 domain-containing protein [Actinomadura darangshiensis]|uniref:DUF3037 domain-containing protein n=1 Tax=Actinomadura darangshiensis TaxID=705336 RepID=A0A4R5BHB5_9ACTN|nr:DUF3037 domain-containing protein [Actinomadura darangshiensis]TDD83224.1 DUF3037 domain-containing protein [Actinomadura darangshiensis]
MSEVRTTNIRTAGEPTVFEYAALRVVPRVERGEVMNVGVVVYCRALDYLGCRSHLDERRLLALDPSLDLAGVRSSLRAVDAVCCGGERAGQAAEESPGARFRWLTAPRSTIVQPGPVHAGLTGDPAAELDRLLDLLVR